MRKLTCLVLSAILPGLLQAQNEAGGSEVEHFYAWWMVLAGAIFSFVFYSFWNMKRHETEAPGRIEGILWFSAALFVWFLSGIMELVWTQDDRMVAFLLKNIFSTINSICILLVIPSVEIKTDKQPLLEKIVALASHKIWVLIIGIAFLVATVLTAVSNKSFFTLPNDAPLPASSYWVFVPDIIFSMLTILALLLVLKAAFQDESRHVTPMTWVVYLTMFVTAVAEISQIRPLFEQSIPMQYEVFYTLAATLFKVLLMILFAILLYSYEVKKAGNLKMGVEAGEEAWSAEAIEKKWKLDRRQVEVLQRLADGETRENIGDLDHLFSKRTNSRKNVDELLGKINTILCAQGLQNKYNQQHILLLFALQHKIIRFNNLPAENFSGNPDDNFPDEN